MPRRDRVTPPELPRDAPVLDVAEEVVVGLLPFLGEDLGPRRLSVRAWLHGLHRLVGHVLHLAEPLRRDHRLDHAAGSRALRERQDVGLRPAGEALLVERLLDRGARALAVETHERTAVLVHRAVEVEDVDLLELVPLTGREVVEVVRGRDLHGAGAELGVDEDGIRDHRHEP